MVVGWGYDGCCVTSNPGWAYSSSGGVRPIKIYLQLRGVSVPSTFSSYFPIRITPSGKTLMVNGHIPNVSGGPAIATVACYADCTNSTWPPLLAIDDFICFLNKYAAGDTYANCDASTTPPVINAADFMCFQTAFAAGCP
ncbi:MAG: GC-type dockerin domain-anchored protein [Phycisphaerales bacterium]